MWFAMHCIDLKLSSPKSFNFNIGHVLMMKSTANVGLEHFSRLYPHYINRGIDDKG